MLLNPIGEQGPKVVDHLLAGAWQGQQMLKPPKICQLGLGTGAAQHTEKKLSTDTCACLKGSQQHIL